MDPTRRLVTTALMAVALGATTASLSRSQDKPLTLDEVLFRASDYTMRYQKDFSAVVAAERYHQEISRRGVSKEARELLSDVLLVKTPDEDYWMGYRDVYEMDGKPVRDRQQRVEKLFLQSRATVQKVADESARLNIGRIKRNFNVPTLPLLFLDPVNQYRFHFQKVGEETLGGATVWKVEYTEFTRPTLIRRGNEDVFTRGAFWIDPAQGRILKTQLLVGDMNADGRAEIVVHYQPDASLGLLVPGEMDERYDNPRRKDDDEILCRATYSKFRRFDVKTSQTVKQPESVK